MKQFSAALLVPILLLACGADRRARRATDASVDDGGVSTMDGGVLDGGRVADGSVPLDADPDGDAGQLDGGAADSGIADGGGSDAGFDAGMDAGPCPPGLAAYYAFEGSAGPVLDECGGHDGIAEGTGHTRGVVGRMGNAIQFNGTDGRVRVPASAELDFLTAGTIELWLRVDGTGVGSTVTRGTGNSDDNVLQNTSCGNLQTIFSRASVGTTNGTTDCELLPTSIWKHTAVVNDGSQIRVYIDGALVRTAEGGYLGPLGSDLYMGRREQGVFPLRGAMDELKWWTIARTQSQICADAGGSFTGGTCTL